MNTTQTNAAAIDDASIASPDAANIRDLMAIEIQGIGGGEVAVSFILLHAASAAHTPSGIEEFSVQRRSSRYAHVIVACTKRLRKPFEGYFHFYF